MPKHNKHNPDYLKNHTADVIKHGDKPAVPNEQWEINMDLTPSGDNWDGEHSFLVKARIVPPHIQKPMSATINEPKI